MAITTDVGHVARISDPLGSTTTCTCDTVSRLVTQTDPLGSVMWYTYDLLDRLSTVADSLQGLTRFTHYANGNLTGTTDRKNQSVG